MLELQSVGLLSSTTEQQVMQQWTDTLAAAVAPDSSAAAPATDSPSATMKESVVDPWASALQHNKHIKEKVVIKPLLL